MQLLSRWEMYGVMQLVSHSEKHMVLHNWWVNGRCEQCYAVVESLCYAVGELLGDAYGVMKLVGRSEM